MQSIPKFIKVKIPEKNVISSEDEKKEDQEKEFKQENESFDQVEPREYEGEIDEIILIPQRARQILAHHEVLEEIPEAELEYEMQRQRNEGLEEILEEEEDYEVEEEHVEDEMEIIEEEVGGEDDFWGEHGEESPPRRLYPVQDDQDLDEWEWTTNGQNSQNGQYRYTRE